MKRVLIFKNFAIFLLCVLCINSCTSASVSTTSVQQNGHVVNYHNNLVIREMLVVSSILNSIPVFGPILNNMFSSVVNLVMSFEYSTNNLLDKVLRDSLPCTISSTNIHCDGVYQNGGLNSILKHAIDTMPNTTPLYVIKKFLDPMVMIGTFLLTGSLF